MNWPMIISAVMGFIVFTLVLVTLLFYIHYRAQKAAKDFHRKKEDPVRGRYFQRFVPRELKDKYDKMKAGQKQVGEHPRVLMAKRINIVTMTLVFGAVAVFTYQWRYRFLNPIDLTADEVAAIDVHDYEWTPTYFKDLPQWEETKALLKTRGLMVLQNRTDRDWLNEEKINLGEKALNSWLAWAQENSIPVDRCSWSRLQDCRAQRPGAIWVVLPGEWDQAKFDQLAQLKIAAIIFGAPAQTYSQKKEFELDGLQFEPAKRDSNRGVILSADRPLTAGFPPLTHFSAYPFSGDYAVRSSEADAYAINEKLEFAGDMEARVRAYNKADSQFVWLDVWPNLNEHGAGLEVGLFNAFWAGTFDLLLGRSHKVVKHWPEGKSYGFLLSLEISKGLSSALEKELESQGLLGKALTTVKIDLAQEKRNIVGQSLEYGHLTCLPAAPRALARSSRFEQSRFFDLCSKVLNTLAGHLPKVFYQPTPDYSPDLLDSLHASRQDILIRSENKSLISTQVMQDRSGARRLIVFNRPNHDHYELKSLGVQDIGRAFSRATEDLKWVKALGGLYVMSIADDEFGLKLLKHFKSELTDAAFKESPEGLGKWFVSREAIRASESRKQASED